MKTAIEDELFALKKAQGIDFRYDTINIDVVERVLRGECLTVTRGGRPVAELRPLPRPGIEAATLLQRWRNLPAVDPDRLRRDIDALIDPSL